MAYETPADLDELQSLLDRSAAAAGTHHRGIHGDKPQVTAVELVDLLSGMQVLDLATVSSKGEPRVAPVDGHLHHAKWMFGSAKTSLRARHLARNPAASVAHTRGEGMCVLTHGHVERFDLRDASAAEMLEHWRSEYPAFDEWFDVTDPVWILHPTHMFVRYPRERGSESN